MDGPWEVIKVWKDSIPAGARLVEAYETDREIVVMGDPHNDPAHNCDEMRCGSLSHVMLRFRKPDAYAPAGPPPFDPNEKYL